MAIVQGSTPVGISAGLSGREVRRVVALILAAEAERRVITPLSGIIPGLSLDDGRLIRDATIRARATAGDDIAALCSHGDDQTLIVSERMLHGAHMSVDTAGQDITVQAIIGARVPVDAMRAAADGAYPGPLRGELVLGLVVTRDPFGDAPATVADLAGVNGGLLGVALCAVTPAGGEEFALTRGDGAVIAHGRLPGEDAVWDAALAACARALNTCPPLAERLMGAASYFSHPFGEPVLALGVGVPVILRPGAALGLDVSALRVATVTSIHPDPHSGGTK